MARNGVLGTSGVFFHMKQHSAEACAPDPHCLRVMCVCFSEPGLLTVCVFGSLGGAWAMALT